MRALAHIPLLSIDKPETVLVIGFGVGNTTHAATLHPSVRRVEVADLSRDVLDHAHYFGDANHDVLRDPRVRVQSTMAGTICRCSRHLPTIWSRSSRRRSAMPAWRRSIRSEFYALARTRLKPGGYLSQWLPAYQVPTETTLAMVRAFIDVFPQSVLLSGAEADLLLVGANGSRIEVDPDTLAEALAERPDASGGPETSRSRRRPRDRRHLRRIGGASCRRDTPRRSRQR